MDASENSQNDGCGNAGAAVTPDRMMVCPRARRQYDRPSRSPFQSFGAQTPPGLFRMLLDACSSSPPGQRSAGRVHDCPVLFECPWGSDHPGCPAVKGVPPAGYDPDRADVEICPVPNRPDPSTSHGVDARTPPLRTPRWGRHSEAPDSRVPVARQGKAFDCLDKDA